MSIDGRTIPINLLQPSSIPFGYSVVAIFSSTLFGASADSSRQKLVLPDGVSESTLYAKLRHELGKILSETIPEISEKNNRTQKTFEDQFPHLLCYFDSSTVGIIDKEEALNSAQQKFFRVQKEFSSVKISVTKFIKSLSKYRHARLLSTSSIEKRSSLR